MRHPLLLASLPLFAVIAPQAAAAQSLSPPSAVNSPAPSQNAPQQPAQDGQPQYPQPQYGQPQYPQPQYAPPQYPQPQYGQPQYPQPQYGQPQYPQPQYAPPPTPIVELRSNDPAATLFQVTGGGSHLVIGRRHRYYSHYDVWSPVCRTPCGVPFDPSGLFQIRGLHLNASSTFVLPQTSLVTLDVDAGHSGPRAGGVILTTFGGISTVVGIVFSSIAVGKSTSSGPSTGFLIAGGAILGIGTAMLAGGITMLVLSRTTVRIQGGSRLAESRTTPRLALLPDGLHF